MKKIPLRNGKFALVDNEDYPRLSKYKWYLSDGYAIRTIRINGLYGDNGKVKQIFIKMSRSILGLINEDPRDVDHRDRIRLNNQKYNLRACTRAENMRNKGLNKRNTSGYKGVSRHKATNKWLASIKAGRKQIYLGLFSCRIDAAKAYDEAAKKYHGEFASLNFNCEVK
ncbi:MAG: AP2 domain-containing protein [Candidatus Ranarchaeia archaeon]